MKINFVGNFQRGYVGEEADETHLAREMENLGHTVIRVPRDEWREHVLDGKPYKNVPENLESDVNIICKWHHFYDGMFARKLREKSGAPVFYWVWDYMLGSDGKPLDWHYKMITASDLYLGNDIMRYPSDVPRQKLYYFPFDVSDKQFDRVRLPKKYDTVFFGSHIPQGDRVEWLTEINKTHPIKIFSWNPEKWEGFDAEPATYGSNFVLEVAQSKIILGFNVNDHTWGYWSNRVGKTLTVGGFLLQRYVPGMELFLRDGAEYFSSIKEANEKISYYLEHDEEREKIANRGYQIGRDRFTSEARIKELMIFIERYLHETSQV
jgi:hypothetical protein